MTTDVASRVRELVLQIAESSYWSERGKAAAKELAALGESAVEGLLGTFGNCPETQTHPIDVYESLLAALGDCAETNSDVVIERLASSPHRYEICKALGHAKCRQSLEALIEASEDKDAFVRRGATSSLIFRRDSEAAAAVIARLRDRSTTIVHDVVDAIRSNAEFRCPEALPMLRKILARKSLHRHLFDCASEAISLIEQERPTR